MASAQTTNNFDFFHRGEALALTGKQTTLNFDFFFRGDLFRTMDAPAVVAAAQQPLAPSQYLDPTLFLTRWYGQSQPNFLPPSASPVPTRQPDLRQDPLPHFTQTWWQKYLILQTPPSASTVPSHQPDQRNWPPFDPTQTWYQRYLQQQTPPSASPVPTAQPGQRQDPLPDFTSTWWEKYLVLQTSPSAGAPSTRQPDQRNWPPFDSTSTWWETLPQKLLPPTASPVPPPPPIAFIADWMAQWPAYWTPTRGIAALIAARITTVFRRTRSQLGTRTGSRQVGRP